MHLVIPSAPRQRLGQSAAPPSRTAAGAERGPARDDEWMAGTGVGWSMRILQADGGRGYVPLFASWTHDVTRDLGPRLVRGRLAWGVEVMPAYLQFRPTRTVGAGVLPLVWRWRLTPRRGVVPFGELAFGGLFTRDPVPENTTAANFLAYGGVGLRFRPNHRVGATVGYRFHHLSNGNARPRNPGVNAHVLWVGVSLAAPR